MKRGGAELKWKVMKRNSKTTNRRNKRKEGYGQSARTVCLVESLQRKMNRRKRRKARTRRASAQASMCTQKGVL